MTTVVIDQSAVDEFSRRVSRGLAEITARIDVGLDSAGRVGQPIQIVAVTKGFPVEAIVAAAEHGLHLFGENYADELLEKANAASALGIRSEWTFQGRLQTNKINRLAPIVGLWQTLDTFERAQALGKRVPSAKVLVQMNSTGDPGRSGCAPDDVAALVGYCRDLGLDVVGLMTVGPDPERIDDAAQGREESLAAFRRVEALADSLDLAIRSMGMSSDLEAALQCGATMVRIGSALFGERSADMR